MKSTLPDCNIKNLEQPIGSSVARIFWQGGGNSQHGPKFLSVLSSNIMEWNPDKGARHPTPGYATLPIGFCMHF